MKTLIQQGIEKGIISFDDEQKNITYIHQKKTRNFTKPEEPIQVDAFLKLIFEYGYETQQIKVNESVKMGVDNKQADIVIYDNKKCEQPYIIVECKRNGITENEFQEAIKQANSYAAALGGKFIWITSGIKDDYYEIPTERPLAIRQIANIPFKGQTEAADYAYVKGGKTPENPGFKELEKVEEGELVKRFKTIHDSLYAEGYTPESALDEVNKLIFCKIFDEKKPRKKGEPYLFQTFTVKYPKGVSDEERKRIDEKSLDDLARRIQDLYNEGRNFDKNIFDDTITLPKEKLRTLVKYLEGISLSETDLDSKGKAFETFASETFRGHMGAFFTPRNIVKMIVETLPIKNTSRVLDTSCGSGGFLLYALDKVRRQADEYFDKKTESVKHHQFWHSFAEKNLFGIELGNKIARTAKMNMILHDDGHTNVISTDGLLKPEIYKERFGNDGFRFDSFDFIITNPPFGSTIKLVEKAYLKEYAFGVKPADWLDMKNTAVKNRDSQSTEILFIEQCYNFLKEGGYAAIVLPDGILTNSSLQDIRDEIEERYRIVAVVSLPNDAFKATKAGVKSSVLFLKKNTKIHTEAIRSQKRKIEAEIKLKHRYESSVLKLEKEKAEILKNHRGFINSTDEIQKKEIEKTEIFKEWKTIISTEYNDKISNIKEILQEEYRLSKQTQLPNYPIFMAITEQIGYDATGKTIAINELDDILPELSRFIDAIEKGSDSFFVLALQ